MGSHQESTIVHIFRAGILLLALIAVPGTAVCWNLFPKDFWGGETPAQTPVSSMENTSDDKIEYPADLSENNAYHSLTARDLTDPFSVTSSYSEKSDADMGTTASPTPLAPPIVPMPRFGESVATADTGSIRTMAHHKDDRTMEQPIPADFAENQAVWAIGEPKTGSPPEALLLQPNEQRPLPQPPSPLQQSQRNFPAIERELKEMGAKYYRLEKWGSRGELFRFSCYVSPQGRHPYQKYFQAIDSDEIRVMERVLGDIRSWREGR